MGQENQAKVSVHSLNSVLAALIANKLSTSYHAYSNAT
jgi:hypothetical protein